MKSYKEITGRYLKSNKKRTALTIVGIIISVALITAIGCLLESIQKSSLESEIKSSGRYNAAFMEVSYDEGEKIKNSVEVQEAGESTNDGFALIYNEGNDEDVENGVYLKMKSYEKSTFDIYNVKVSEGRLPESGKEIILSKKALNVMGKSLGDMVELKTGSRIDKETGEEVNDTHSRSSEEFNVEKVSEYKIVGITDTDDFGNAQWNGYSFLDSSLKDKPSYNVSVVMKKPKYTHETAAKIAENIGHGDCSIDYNEGLLRFYGGSSNKDYNFTLISMVAIIIGIVMISTIATIYNAFHISVMERKKEFGTLRSIGAAPRQIRNIVFKEAWMMALIAIPFGILFGILGLKVTFLILEKCMASAYETSLFYMELSVTPRVIIISIALSLVTLFLSAYLPARRAGKISPMDAIRSADDIKPRRIKKRSLAGKLFKAEGYIASRNIRRNRRKFRVTIFSITISVMLFIVFNSLSSLMSGVTGLDSQYVPDYVIYYTSEGNLTGSMSDVNEIKKFDGVKNVFINMGNAVSLKVDDDKVNKDENIDDYTVNGKVQAIGHIEYPGDDGIKDAESKLIKGTADKNELTKENGVIILQKNRDSADEKRRYVNYFNYDVGDYITFYDKYDYENPGGPTHKVKVLGIIDEPIKCDSYLDGAGITMITTEEVLKNIGQDNDGRIDGIYVETSKDEDPGLKPYLQKMAEDNNAYFNDTKAAADEEKKYDMMMDVFMYGFVAIITLLSAVSIVNTITTNVLLRKREMAMLQAVGMTTSSLYKSIYIESSICSFSGWLYGTVLGSGVSFLMYKVIMRSIEFAWRIPYKPILIALLGTLIISMIAARIPISKLKKENIIENIRKESI